MPWIDINYSNAILKLLMKRDQPCCNRSHYRRPEWIIEGGFEQCCAGSGYRRMTRRVSRELRAPLGKGLRQQIGAETRKSRRYGGVLNGYWLEIVAVVPSNLVKVTVNGSLYASAPSLRKLSATASPSSKEVSLSLRQWMPAWMP